MIFSSSYIIFFIKRIDDLNTRTHKNKLEVNSQTFYIFIETLQIVLSKCSLQMSYLFLIHSTISFITDINFFKQIDIEVSTVGDLK